MNQLDMALQLADIEEFSYTDRSTGLTHEANNFVFITSICTPQTCTTPYLGDEGNRTTNGSPWLWSGNTSAGIMMYQLETLDFTLTGPGATILSFTSADKDTPYGPSATFPLVSR